MKIVKVLLKVTHLKSLKTLMYQGFKVVFILFLLLLLLSTTINKNKYIYSLLGALKVSYGNMGNKILESLGAVRLVLISKSNKSLILGVFQ